MRLMADGEQPIDKYVRHKEDSQAWYREMEEYNLLEVDIKVLERHLKDVSGVSATQEELMLLLMDEDICNFSVTDANFARKVVGKKVMEDIPKVREMMFSQGKGSNELKEYVWDTQISPQMMYSFSRLHSTGYSLIALQNINLAHQFPRVFWDASCLTVSAGADEDNEHNKGTDYGRIGTAIGNLQAQDVKVLPPLINRARFGFDPDVEGNGIIFSLKGITTMSDEASHQIIENRPYVSFEDFHERMYLTKKISRSQMVQLIKAGAFNEFDDKLEIMKKFILKETPVKDKLNGQNLQRIISYGLLNSPGRRYLADCFNVRKYLKSKVVKKLPEEKNNWLKLPTSSADRFFMIGFTSDCVVSMDAQGLIIDEKKMEKEYKEITKPLQELYKDEEFLRAFNNAQYMELWQKHASGTVENWEMESTSFYSDKHEVSYIDKDEYNIVDFHELSEEPVVIRENVGRNGRVYQEMQLFTIAGVVLNKNKDSRTITLLTETGIVVVKSFASQFAKYDRQIKRDGKIVESSWFKRGEILLLSGFRRSNQFVLRAPRGENPIALVNNINKDGSLQLQFERDL